MPAPAPSMADKDKDKKKLKLILKLPRSSSAVAPAAAAGGAPALPSSRAGPAAAPATALPSSFLSRPAASAQPHHPPQAPGGPGPASRAAPAPAAAARWNKGSALSHLTGNKGLPAAAAAAASGLRSDPSGAAAGLRTDSGQWNGPGAGFGARPSGAAAAAERGGGGGVVVARGGGGGGWQDPEDDDDAAGTPPKKRKFKTVAESTARSSPAHAAKDRMSGAEEPGWAKPVVGVPGGAAAQAASALPPLAKKPALAIKKSESHGESGATEPPVSGRHAPDPLPPKQALEGVLDKLQKKDTYGVFAEPVDSRMVPDYYDVIKKPMDFGTIRKKLSKGIYMHLEQFEADIMLICSNAMRYNAPNTVYYKQARAIQDMARKLVPALQHPMGLDGDRRLAVKPKSSSGSKKAGKKVPIGKSRFDPAGSDYTSGATLATDGDARGVASERSGSIGGEDSEIQAGGWGGVAQGGTHDTGGTWIQEDSTGMALKPVATKDGRRPLSTEEYHRSSYKSRNLPAHGQGPVLAAVGGEQQQLVFVGSDQEYAYARSLACFSANLGPSAWEFAAKKIQKVLAPNIAFGPGWVGEPKVLQSSSQLQNGRSQGTLFTKTVLAEQHKTPQTGLIGKLAQSLSAASSGHFPPAAAPRLPGDINYDRKPAVPSVRPVVESMVRSGSTTASVIPSSTYESLKPAVPSGRVGLESAMRPGAVPTVYDNLKSAAATIRPGLEPAVRQSSETLLRPSEPVRKPVLESLGRQAPPSLSGQYSSMNAQTDISSRSRDAKVFMPPQGFGTFSAAQQGGMVDKSGTVQPGGSVQAVSAPVAELRTPDFCIDSTVQEAKSEVGNFGQFDLSIDGVADRGAVPLKGLAPVFSKDGLIGPPSSVGKSVEERSIRGGSKCSTQSRSSNSLDGQASGSTMDGGVSLSDASVMQPSGEKLCKEDSQMRGGMQTATRSLSSEETGGSSLGTGAVVGSYTHPEDKVLVSGRAPSSWVQLQAGPCIPDQPASRDNRGATAMIATGPGENGFTGHVVPLSMLPTIMGVPTTAGVDEYALKAWAQAQAQAHAMTLLQHADPKTRAAIQAQLAAGWQPLPVNANFAPNLQAHYMQQQQQQQLNGVSFVQPPHPSRPFPLASANAVASQISHVGSVTKAPDTRDVTATGRQSNQAQMGYAGNGRTAQQAGSTMGLNNASQHAGQLPSGRHDLPRNSEVSNPFLGSRPVASQSLPQLQVGNPYSLSHAPGRVHVPQQQSSSQNSGTANSVNSQHYAQAHSSCSNPGISSRPMPPDLNICFQPPASPTTPKTLSGPKMLVDSQQPDLALQL